MSTLRLTSFLSLAALGLGLSASLGATTVSVATPAPANFTSIPLGPSLPGGWTSSGVAGIANTSVTSQYLDPFTSGGNYFAYAGMNGSVTANFAGGITALDILWGSPDTWNMITFTDLNGNTQSLVPGSGLLGVLAPNPNASSFVLFSAAPGTVWTSVVFSSSSPAFEFGDVSILPNQVTVPEPAALALALCGFGLVGLARRRKSA